jgi:hypothetical protein
MQDIQKGRESCEKQTTFWSGSLKGRNDLGGYYHNVF